MSPRANDQCNTLCGQKLKAESFPDAVSHTLRLTSAPSSTSGSCPQLTRPATSRRGIFSAPRNDHGSGIRAPPQDPLLRSAAAHSSALAVTQRICRALFEDPIPSCPSSAHDGDVLQLGFCPHPADNTSVLRDAPPFQGRPFPSKQLVHDAVPRLLAQWKRYT